MVTRQPTVIVIGAGVGGLAAAAQLARQGFQVTIVEKQPGPGGRCSNFEVDGHTFDVGPTLFIMREIYELAFQQMGERLEDHLDLMRVDPTYHITFDDGSTLALTSDMPAMREQLEGIEAGSFGRMLRYIEEGGRQYAVSMADLVTRNFRSPGEYFNLRNLSLLFRLKIAISHYRNASRYFDDPRLRSAFTFQDMYMGLSPYEAPALYSFMQYSELTDGVYFPMGGMHAVVKALEQIALKHGCELRYNHEVSEIEISHGQARGVIFPDGQRMQADFLLANADLPHVILDLLPRDRSSSRMKRLRYSCSTVNYYWGLDTQFQQLQPHNLFLSDQYRENFEKILDDYSIGEKPSCYIHVPTRLDHGMGPPGRDTLVGIVPVGHINPAVDQDWEAIQQKARRTLIDRVESLGVLDFEDHIVVERHAIPHHWRENFNLVNGSTHGLAHNLTQMGYLRPHNRHDRIPNLYFVGASTHPGTGIPTVLISAQLVTERILEELDCLN
jgi:phytoene desaturase